MTGGFGSAVLELLEEARLADPALPRRGAADHRDPRRPVRRPRLGRRPAAAASGSTRPGSRRRSARRSPTLGLAAPAPSRSRPVRRPRAPDGLAPDAAERRPPVRAATGREPGRAPSWSAGGALCHDRPVSAETIQAAGGPARLDQLLVERGLRRARSRAQALVLAGQVRVGEGDGARTRPQAGRPRRPADRRRRRWPPSRTSRAAATSSRPRSTRSRSIRPAWSASTSARRPAGSRTCCCSAARGASTPSTSGAASWPTRFGATRGSSRSSGRTRGRSTPGVLPRAGRARRGRRLVHLAAPRPRARSAACFGPPAGRSCRSSSRSSRPDARQVDRGVVRDPAVHRGSSGASSRAARELGLAAATRSRRRSSGRPATASSCSTWRRRDGQPRRRRDRAGARPADRRAPRRGRRGMTAVAPDRLRLQPDPRGRRRAPRPGRGLVRACGASTTGRAPRATSTAPRRELPTTDVADRPRRRRDVPARGAGRVGGRRAAARRQPRQGRLPLQGRGRRARGASSARSSPATTRSTSGWRCAGRDPPGGPARRRRTFVALNDVVVARGALARVVRLDVAIGPSHLATFIADGLVVASPTGSTGYSFSAGGPILDPLSRNLIVTPIAGYLSAIRSVVVSPRQVVTLPGRRRARGPGQHRRPGGHAARGRRRRRGAAGRARRSASSSRRRDAVLGPAPAQGGAAAVVSDGRPVACSSWRSPTSR